ncbi:hypothetical protein RA210_U360014 [Rubrivivax sp. A210]|nr:hypothetical protein RA210_U360014 [Rubrivivax sp. A210]
MHPFITIAAARKATKCREQRPSLKATRVFALKPTSQMNIGPDVQHYAENLIGQLFGVAAYASPAQHRRKTPSLPSIRSSETLASSCWAPEPRRSWSPWQCHQVGSRQGVHHWPSKAWPNTSLKLSPNGKTPGPGHRYAVHFLWPGPGVSPSVPA